MWAARTRPRSASTRSSSKLVERNGESTDNLRYEHIAHSVDKMLPNLRKKHGERKIDFDVVVRNGKVGLKAIVRRH